ncbi:MAG: branched-chain amino acid ABC transporter permease [Anaerolineae bacterium]|nr:branched-chain amino acid ABC transporter permease [Anaerolineae bacterium]
MIQAGSLLPRLRRVDASQIVVWVIGIGLLSLVVIGSISTLRAGTYTGRQWLDFVIFGMAQGGIYALIALGYTMVYGVLRMINFAHSEVFMSGAFTAYFLADFLARRGWMDQYPIPSLLAVMAFSASVSTTIAIVLERVAYRPLRRAPRLVPLITAIGASFFLQYTFRGLYGAGVKVYPEVAILKGTVFGIQKTLIVVFFSAMGMLALLYLFIQHTRTGRAIRAVSADLETAALMGVNVDRVIATTFAVGGVMAGIAGVLYALIFKQVHFFMGFIPGIKAFTSAVLGGIGNLPGAALGGLFLGVFESIGPSLFLDGLGIRAAHQLKDVIAFTMLVLILIFRPTGILGERLAEKRA